MQKPHDLGALEISRVETACCPPPSDHKGTSHEWRNLQYENPEIPENPQTAAKAIADGKPQRQRSFSKTHAAHYRRIRATFDL